MTVHATAPSLSLFPQRSPISDPALAQALPRKQTDRDLGLIQPTAVLGGLVHGEPIPQPASGLFAEAFHHRLARNANSDCPAPNGWCPHQEVRPPQAMRPGRVARRDGEYKRCGFGPRDSPSRLVLYVPIFVNHTTDVVAL